MVQLPESGRFRVGSIASRSQLLLDPLFLLELLLLLLLHHLLIEILRMVVRIERGILTQLIPEKVEFIFELLEELFSFLEHRGQFDFYGLVLVSDIIDRMTQGLQKQAKAFPQMLAGAKVMIFGNLFRGSSVRKAVEANIVLALLTKPPEFSRRVFVLADVAPKAGRIFRPVCKVGDHQRVSFWTQFGRRFRDRLQVVLGVRWSRCGWAGRSGGCRR